MLILQILLMLPDLGTSAIDFLTQQNQEQHLTLTYTLCQWIGLYLCFSSGSWHTVGSHTLPGPQLAPKQMCKRLFFLLFRLVTYVPRMLCPLLYFYYLSHIFPLIRLSEQHRELDSNRALTSST